MRRGALWALGGMGFPRYQSRQRAWQHAVVSCAGRSASCAMTNAVPYHGPHGTTFTLTGIPNYICSRTRRSALPRTENPASTTLRQVGRAAMDATFNDWAKQSTAKAKKPGPQTASESVLRPSSALMATPRWGTTSGTGGDSGAAPSFSPTGAVSASAADALAAAMQGLNVEEGLGAPSGEEGHGSDTGSDASSGDELDPGHMPGNRTSPTELTPPSASCKGDARVGLLYDQSMEQHFGPGAPARPQRLSGCSSSLVALLPPCRAACMHFAWVYALGRGGMSTCCARESASLLACCCRPPALPWGGSQVTT